MLARRAFVSEQGYMSDILIDLEKQNKIIQSQSTIQYL